MPGNFIYAVVILTENRMLHQRSFVFEITQQCNLQCLHCYNAWKSVPEYPRGESGATETLDILGKMLDETGASLVSLSGGEPLLRPDIAGIVNYLHRRSVAVNIITNGTLLTGETLLNLLPDKVSIFELPLLSADRSIHDRMSGMAGAFDKTTEAVAELKLAKQRVVAVFVATRLNLPTWLETAELAIALGVDGIMFNRFNPGGEGAKNIDLLQASPEELQSALDIAEDLSVRYQIPVSCSIAMPPCLFDVKKYQRLSFGFCAAGTERAYYCIDLLGNVRPCNHSPTILGNIRQTTFETIAKSPSMVEFMSASPEFCRGCRIETVCRGGCKASAESCFHSASLPDPFLKSFQHQAEKIS